jgi:hypothetical protein
MLLYFDAGWWVLSLLLGSAGLFTLMALPALFAGLGIANEKKLGYWGGLAVAGLNVILLVLVFVAIHGQSIGVIISLIFGIALVALLVHPMSRSYQKIWFKKLRGPTNTRRRLR